jgi:ATP-binding cassette subfamily C protein
MRLLFNLIKAYPWRTAIALAAILLAGIADGLSITALLPLLNIVTNRPAAGTAESQADGSGMEQLVVNALAAFGLEATLGTLLAVIVLGVLVKNAMMYLSDLHIGYSGAHITTRLRLQLLRSVLSSRWNYFLHQPIGKLANSLSNEAKRSSALYVYGITMLAFIVLSVVYAAIAFAMSWEATLAVFGIAIAILAMSHFLVRMSKRAGKRQTVLAKSLLSRLTDTLLSVKPLKAMAREEQTDSVLSAETSALNRALRHQVQSQAALNAIQGPLFAIVIATGIYLALEHWEMEFARVMVLVVLLGKVLSQIGKVQKAYQKMAMQKSAFASIQKTIQQADEAVELMPGTLEPVLESSIRLDHISFSYGDKTVLKDVSIEIPTNTLTTIIGPSGAGKTTLIDLVIGLYEPDSGTILIDDTPLPQLDLKKWRQKIGYVPQEQILLHDSIATNVSFGDPQITETDVIDALRSANAWEFVQALPKGIHTSVGERGAKLSGGQRQRIMIARALAHRPQLLILDEPTSALDPKSEALISETLLRLSRQYTILAISHQTALAEIADRTYRLHNGHLAEDRNSPEDQPALAGTDSQSRHRP